MKNAERVEDVIPNYDEVITNLVTYHIRYHTIRFFKKTGVDTFVPEGTGVLVSLYGVFCVFTAGHVTENMDDHRYLYFRFGPNKYIPCTGTLRDSDDKIRIILPDVTYVILDQNVVEQLLATGMRFLTLDKILLEHEGLQTYQYVMYGYPSDVVEDEESNLIPDGFYFINPLADDKPYDRYIYTKDTHYILRYSNPRYISTGAKTKTRQLYDTRGSGLWYISVTKEIDKYVYDYHLIGLMNEYYQHKRSQYIIANKISIITDQLRSDIS